MRLELDVVGYRTRNKQLEAALREIAEDAEDDFASAKDMGWTARKAMEDTK
jgi:hypothetical protein